MQGVVKAEMRENGPLGQRRERPCYSGCYNRIPEAGWLINTEIFFLTILESRKPKINVLEDSVSGDGLLSGSSITIFLGCLGGPVD